MKIKILTCQDCGSKNLTVEHFKEIVDDDLNVIEPEGWNCWCNDCNFEMNSFEGNQETFIKKWNDPERVECEIEIIEKE